MSLFDGEADRIHDERVAFPMPARAAVPLRNAGRQMRPPVERDHASVVNRLHDENHFVRRLHDLEHAAVRRREPRHAERDASFAQAPAPGSVGGIETPLLRGRGPPRLRFGRIRRDAPVRRIDDQRCPPLEVTRRQPERVVVAGLGVVRLRFLVAGNRVENQLVAEQSVAVLLELARRALHGRELGVREEFLVGPLRGTLERRGVVVRPGAREIGMAERSAWRRERLRGRTGRFAGLSPRGRRCDARDREDADGSSDAAHERAFQHI